MSPSTRPDQVEAEDSKQSLEPTLEHTVESNETSIMTSEDPALSEEKAPEAPPKPVVEYPKGLEVFFIMLALILSITLCSLDQVSFGKLPNATHKVPMR